MSRYIIASMVLIIVAGFIEPNTVYYVRASEKPATVLLGVSYNWDEARTITEIEKVWGKDSKLGIAIATCESRMDVYANGTTTNKHGETTDDRGLFQISANHHDMEDYYNPYENIKYAYALYREGGAKYWKASSHCWSKKI